MTQNNKRTMWQKPWGYPESISVVAGTLLIGLVLQLTVGSFDFYLLAFPNNIIIGFVLLIASVAMGIFASRSSFIRWFSGVPMSVVLILAFVLLSLIMGLVLQVKNSNTKLGLDAMNSHWAFVLVYTLTLLSLGIIIVRRLLKFRISDYAFHLNHIGLWLFLFASGLGYADMERYIMYVREGETEWRVYDDQNNVKELPLAIQLNDFDMDVYPPKLVVIDRSNGDVQPKDNPDIFQIDKDQNTGSVFGWDIEVQEYIHEAVRNADSTYRPVPMPGATPAVKITASRNDTILEGWVCGGNQAQIHKTLPVDESHSIVMTVAEPRSFRSDIVAFTESGEQTAKVIEVNKPLSVGNWTIYQYGYDNNAGRLSSYSSFELVYDPWLTPVFAGIIMMMLGSLAMLWTGRKGKEIQNDME
ncbi:MAG: cytochrome c biogenesis protein ResB [Bacteroidales bacterium]